MKISFLILEKISPHYQLLIKDFLCVQCHESHIDKEELLDFEQQSYSCCFKLLQI